MDPARVCMSNRYRIARPHNEPISPNFGSAAELSFLNLKDTVHTPTVEKRTEIIDADHNLHPRSHTRTVVRECCKGDDASQWENGKFDPLPPPNPLTDRHKKLHT